ncbi:MAG: hypothetical protein HOP29_11635, partial [Phycisphaerales bacterium]|nr:hypothetical protein [Phycisphaerales bacterium]
MNRQETRKRKLTWVWPLLATAMTVVPAAPVVARERVERRGVPRDDGVGRRVCPGCDCACHARRDAPEGDRSTQRDAFRGDARAGRGRGDRPDSPARLDDEGRRPSARRGNDARPEQGGLRGFGLRRRSNDDAGPRADDGARPRLRQRDDRGAERQRRGPDATAPRQPRLRTHGEERPAGPAATDDGVRRPRIRSRNDGQSNRRASAEGGHGGVIQLAAMQAVDASVDEDGPFDESGPPMRRGAGRRGRM